MFTPQADAASSPVAPAANVNSSDGAYKFQVDGGQNFL